MLFYKSKELDAILTKEEYENLIKLEINLNVGDECTFGYLDGQMVEATKYEVLNNISVGELLDNGSASYRVTDNYGINVVFDILDEVDTENDDESDLLDTQVCITDIEIV